MFWPINDGKLLIAKIINLELIVWHKIFYIIKKW